MNEMRLSVKKIISILLLFTFTKLFAFEEKNILSPISGVWKNKQALVLNLEKARMFIILLQVAILMFLDFLMILLFLLIRLEI